MSTTEFLHQLLRAQFGLWAGFHFLFVPVSLGLLLCVNLLRTCEWRTRRQPHRDAARIFTRFFLLAWVVGVLTGYPLRWQLAGGWTRYSEEAQPVLQSIFDIEGWIGPVMLCGIALLAMGRRAIGTLGQVVVGWVLLVAMLAQSWTILSVNAWMQHPAGAHHDGQRWQLDALSEVLLQPTALLKFAHTSSAAMLCGALFVAWVALSHQKAGHHLPMARASIRVAAWVAALATVGVLLSGHESAVEVEQTQPAKFAAMEAHWRAEAGWAPLVLLADPDPLAGRNRYALEIPGLLSALTRPGGPQPLGLLDLVERAQPEIERALADPGRPDAAGWRALYDAVAERSGSAWTPLEPAQRLRRVAQASIPPVGSVFAAFHLMVYAGVALAVVSTLLFVHRKALSENRKPRLARLIRGALPLPWIATLSGWAVAEIGRQPWTIYGHLPTWQASVEPGVADAFSRGFLHLVAAFALGTMCFGVGAWIYRDRRARSLDPGSSPVLLRS